LIWFHGPFEVFKKVIVERVGEVCTQLRLIPSNTERNEESDKEDSRERAQGII